MSKTIIYYHRAYRKITSSGRVFTLEFLAITLPLVLLILLLYPLITERICLLAKDILSSYYPSGAIKLIKQAYLLGDITIIDSPETFPSFLTSFINLIVSLGLIIILPRVRKNKNIAIYLLYLAVINLVSSLFFILFSTHFPYPAVRFSDLYIKTEISMWLFIPVILGMAFLPLPSSIFPKLGLIIFTLIYSVIFGALRYIIFLFIIYKFSVIYMALLYFAFGPFIDFVYIVGIYCFYNTKLAHNLKGKESVWKWSY